MCRTPPLVAGKPRPLVGRTPPLVAGWCRPLVGGAIMLITQAPPPRPLATLAVLSDLILQVVFSVPPHSDWALLHFELFVDSSEKNKNYAKFYQQSPVYLLKRVPDY